MKIYVDSKDVMIILGCARTKAYEAIQEVNEKAIQNKYRPFPNGKANKYLFAEMFGIPAEAIDKILERS